MADALNIALGGLNATGAQFANTTASIVNASSTKKISSSPDGDLASNLVALGVEKTQYAAEAKVVSAVEKNNKTLLDILA